MWFVVLCAVSAFDLDQRVEAFGATLHVPHGRVAERVTGAERRWSLEDGAAKIMISLEDLGVFDGTFAGSVARALPGYTFEALTPAVIGATPPSTRVPDAATYALAYVAHAAVATRLVRLRVFVDLDAARDLARWRGYARQIASTFRVAAIAPAGRYVRDGDTIERDGVRQARRSRHTWYVVPRDGTVFQRFATAPPQLVVECTATTEAIARETRDAFATLDL